MLLLALSLFSPFLTPSPHNSTEILRDIPIVPEGPGLIAYLEILEKVLVPPPSVIAQARAAERGRGAGNDVLHVDRSKMPRPGGKKGEDVSFEAKGTSVGLPRDGKDGKKTAAHADNKDSPVSVLVTVIRKALNSFISTDETLESAWMCLLKAFRRFDPSENGTVSPRDFCLAVSVLLGGDEVLLSEAAWIEVIEQFTHKDPKKGSTAARGGGASDKSNNAQVDYMEFCGAILDTQDLKAAGKARKGLSAGTSALPGASSTQRPLSSTSAGGRGATQGALSRERARASTKR